MQLVFFICVSLRSSKQRYFQRNIIMPPAGALNLESEHVILWKLASIKRFIKHAIDSINYDDDDHHDDDDDDKEEDTTTTMMAYGLSSDAITLMRSYLTGRRQRVKNRHN